MIYKDSAMVSCRPRGVAGVFSSSSSCCCWGAPQCLECRDGARTRMSETGWGRWVPMKPVLQAHTNLSTEVPGPMHLPLTVLEGSQHSV